MLPALRGPAVFVPHIIRVCPSDRCLICLGFYLHGPGPFCLHSGRLHDCILVSCLYCYIVFHICCSWVGFPTGGGEGVPFSSFSGFLQVGSLGGATLVK